MAGSGGAMNGAGRGARAERGSRASRSGIAGRAAVVPRRTVGAVAAVAAVAGVRVVPTTRVAAGMADDVSGQELSLLSDCSATSSVYCSMNNGRYRNPALLAVSHWARTDCWQPASQSAFPL